MPIPSQAPPTAPPPAWARMLPWALVSVLLAVLASWAQELAPGNLLAVTVYKAHLLALGGWGGYWLDRALFPYDRPHLYLLHDPDEDDVDGPGQQGADYLQVADGHNTFGHAMLRRAIVVAACVLCVGLGA